MQGKMVRLITAMLVTATLIGAGAATAATKKQVVRCDKYAFVAGPWTWAAARADALSSGGRLASITSDQELACVVSAANGASGWLAGTDADVEGTWRWVDAPKGSGGTFWSDGATTGFTNWGAGEPNNSGDEDCLVLNGDGTWNDATCGNSAGGYLIRYP
jgi:hypothetical protein